MNDKTAKILQFWNKIKTSLLNYNMIILIYLLVTLLIYLLFIFTPEKIFHFKYSTAALVYIILSATSIIMTTWGEQIESLIQRLFTRGSNKEKVTKNINEKKVRFILIFIYFVAIVVFTIASLMSISIFDIDKMDYCIIQSFATYIAYDRLIRNYSTIIQ